MWSLFSVHDSTYLLLSLQQITSSIHYEAAMQQFFLLGLIPFTNIQLSFSDIVIACWSILFITLCWKLYHFGLRTIKSIDPLEKLPASMTYFDSIAL